MAGARIDRRALLAGLFALPGLALAGAPGGVALRGNSFLGQHDVTGQVAAMARDGCGPIPVDGAFVYGRWLRQWAADEATLAGLRREPPAWLVLQDHSRAALTPRERAASAEAVARLREALPDGRIVLVAPWPRAEGHTLYAEPGMPGDPVAMVRRTMDHVTLLARRHGAQIAPVAELWLKATARGHRLYDRDGYHANADGAALMAMTIAATLGLDPRRAAEASDPALAAIAAEALAPYGLCDEPVA